MVIGFIAAVSGWMDVDGAYCSIGGGGLGTWDWGIGLRSLARYWAIYRQQDAEDDEMMDLDNIGPSSHINFTDPRCQSLVTYA
jgi:hypothetical protein